MIELKRALSRISGYNKIDWNKPSLRLGVTTTTSFYTTEVELSELGVRYKYESGNLIML
jgi:hypothetical protein